MRWKFYPAILILSCIIATARGTDIPATQSSAVDLSSPKATVRSMMTAVATADAPALVQVFEAPTPAFHELVSGYAELIVAGRRLRDAARDKFADDPTAKPVVPAPAEAGASAVDLALLDSADVQVTDNAATVQLSDHRPAIRLHLTENHWRIDLADYSGVSAGQIAEQTELNLSLAAAMEEATGEIATGKYASAQEAESGVQQKIHAVIARQLKSNPPTTSPTTAPATQM